MPDPIIVNVDQSALINTLEDHGNKIDALEVALSTSTTKDVEQDARLTALETKDVEQDDRLTALETKVVDLEARLSAIEEGGEINPPNPPVSLGLVEGYAEELTGGEGLELFTITEPDEVAFNAALGSNRKIVLDFDGVMQLTDNIRLDNLENLSIVGVGNVTLRPIQDVSHTIVITGCTNVFLSNFRVSHYATVERDAITILGGCDLIGLDHLSLRWGTDENLGIKSSTRVTVQWCIFAECLLPHSCGCLVREETDKINFHHCLFVNNNSRNPQWGVADNVNAHHVVTNNVSYNEGIGSVDRASLEWKKNGSVAAINNFYKAGPEKQENKDFAMSAIDGLVYENGNIFEGVSTWLRPEDEVRRTTTLFDFPVVEIESAQDAYNSVLQSAGCLPHDATDLRVINDVMNGTGSHKTSIPAGE